MGKEKLIGVFKLENIFLGLIVTTLALIMILAGNGENYVSMAWGMIIGVWIGVLFNHFIQIPKIYGDKDERELILKIVAMYLSVSFAFIISFILFTLAALGVFSLVINQYFAALLIIIVLTFGIRFLSYKLLLNFL